MAARRNQLPNANAINCQIAFELGYMLSFMFLVAGYSNAGNPR